MSKEYSFENMPEDPDKPIIGIYQKLFEAEKRKKIEREQTKAKQAAAVDNSLLVTNKAASNIEAPSNFTSPSNIEAHPNIEAPSNFKATNKVKRSKSSTETAKTVLLDNRRPSNIESPSNIEAGVVKITNNYMRFDKDIFDVIKIMSESETRIYLDLILLSYGQLPAKNICSTTNNEIAARTGITSSSSFSTAFKGLERRGYIKRLLESHQRNQKSLYRVYLPSELPGFKSITKIEVSG